MDPVSAGLMIGTAAFGTATSAQAARRRNDAIERSMASQSRSAAVRQRQVAEQAAVERQKEIDAAHRIRGRLRVAAGEAGVGLGGSYAALMRQADTDAATNVDIINRNENAQQTQLRSGLEANLSTLSSRTQNPLIAGLSGGLSGLQTGLSIGGGIRSARELGETPEPGESRTITPPSLVE